jgi:hypothetical protein
VTVALLLLLLLLLLAARKLDRHVSTGPSPLMSGRNDASYNRSGKTLRGRRSHVKGLRDAY